MIGNGSLLGDMSSTRSLARHSDIHLTLQTYTHVELHDQTAAIRALPDPGASTALPEGDALPRSTGTASVQFCGRVQQTATPIRPITNSSVDVGSGTGATSCFGPNS